MMTQTKEVPTTQQTTAMMIMPVVVDSSSSPDELPLNWLGSEPEYTCREDKQ